APAPAVAGACRPHDRSNGADAALARRLPPSRWGAAVALPDDRVARIAAAAWTSQRLGGPVGGRFGTLGGGAESHGRGVPGGMARAETAVSPDGRAMARTG